MSNPLVSGLWSLIISSTRISAAARRESLYFYQWSARRISTTAWSSESTLPMCRGGFLGYGNRVNNYLGKLLPHMAYGSSILSAKPIERTQMIKIRSLRMMRAYVRSTTNITIELNTKEDVLKFNIGNECRVRESPKKLKKNIEGKEKKKKSRKAKLNELRYYRLIAKRKMNSPDPEVRIRYKLEKAKRKEEWLIEKVRKFELPKAPPETHDPELLTEEERFYLKRIGEKKKHYVPVGRRGVFGGVVLNMHLHWKNHETVKVVCRPCKPGQINQYAEELSRLSKGIAIDIKPNNIIIFYRGKNYVQPEVMSPSDTLSKAKALEKYRYEQSLEHTSQFIEKLESELEEYLEHAVRYKKMKNGEMGTKGIEE